ncbi:uncharacterized protein EI90DRAFT_1242333 [Cantharellus anzutake]|uniref:uncharacterized protein n=1 Tax=Cantharellus anzutake TaxID=1750568 RepID=UPI001903539A|nr:uncharacterized protein EI90DRAFT_1242333 [Cantharellus anzutake]KAF8310332.1 hypothetical protein EI90DRAFT_1242333 [Cantharellus anzutake]
MHNLVNVQVGKSEDRTLLTGLHTVADIYCLGCGVTLGWTYLRAHEPSQRYKEGKLSVMPPNTRFGLTDVSIRSSQASILWRLSASSKKQLDPGLLVASRFTIPSL